MPEIYIATPEDAKPFQEASPVEAERMLREQGFDLGDLAWAHFLLHAQEPADGRLHGGSYFTTECQSSTRVGGTPFREYDDALDDFAGTARVHLSHEGPYLLIVPSDIYGSHDGDFLFSILKDELGCDIRHVSMLKDDGPDETVH
jgi:hypothetical protein